jgi:hypothetical protein
MSDAARPAAAALEVPSLARVWPDPGRAAGPRMLTSAGVAGLLAAAVLPGRPPGLGALVVVLVVLGVAAATAGRRQHIPLGVAALCLLLCCVLTVRAAGWILALDLLAAVGLAVVTLCDARTVPGVVATSLALPVALLRGLPWLGRGLTALGGRRVHLLWPVTRTALVTAGLAAVFGWLFATADAVFAEWVGALLPTLSAEGFGTRLVALGVTTTATLALGYVAAVPPLVDRLARPAAPVRRFEWAVPVLAVDLLFAVFLVAQLASLFGGDRYVRTTTGLTYAEYVHQGFGQLVAATLLTLLVVATAARRAARRLRVDRVLLRTLLGVLCVLTLVVVGSALHRLYVYEQAYGFTRLRLLVGAFELWLGFVVLLVLVAGIALSGHWLARAAVTGGAVALLLLALLNPDAYVARHNVDRFERTGRIDWVYLRSLSADAVPTLDRLPEPYRSCVLAGIAPVGHDDLLGWNLGRARAAEVLRTQPVVHDVACGPLPVG